jgi:hypothetical protein
MALYFAETVRSQGPLAPASGALMSAQVKNRGIAHTHSSRPNGREALKRLASKLGRGEAAGLAEQSAGMRWSPDDLADAFGNIVSGIADEPDSEDAVDALLVLIQSEVDKLEAMMAVGIEEARRSGARIDHLLDQAARHQTGTDRWLSHLP